MDIQFPHRWYNFSILLSLRLTIWLLMLLDQKTISTFIHLSSNNLMSHLNKNVRMYLFFASDSLWIIKLPKNKCCVELLVLQLLPCTYNNLRKVYVGDYWGNFYERRTSWQFWPNLFQPTQALSWILLYLSRIVSINLINITS